ncbi:hypothetical protein A1D31_37965 [Bradyrhizobium liaoningense]|nr:hypothetical protein A1D31_37965 [Bradyrhizobium liaoningense]
MLFDPFTFGNGKLATEIRAIDISPLQITFSTLGIGKQRFEHALNKISAEERRSGLFGRDDVSRRCG